MSKVLKNTALISALIIVLGGLKTTIYYRHFNINISQYIDTSELTTLFAKDLLTFTVIGAVYFAMITFLTTKEEVEKRQTDWKSYSKLSLKKRALRYLKIMRWQLLIFGIVLSWLYYLLQVFGLDFKYPVTVYDSILTSLAVILIYLLPFIIIEFQIHYKALHGNTINWLTVKGVMLALFACGLVVAIAFGQISQVERSDAYYGTKVLLNDSTQYNSDSTIFYLGKSHDFVYFYDSKKSKGIVIPTEKVAKFELKNPL